MAKELTKSEERSLHNLQSNMEERLVEFKNKYQGKSKEELLQELSKLEEYLQGCYNSEIDDTEISIRFHEGKTLILKKLINQTIRSFI